MKAIQTHKSQLYNYTQQQQNNLKCWNNVKKIWL